MNENTIMESERLFLRPLAQADYADLAEILQNPEVMVAYEGPFDDGEVQAWLDRQLSRYAQDSIGLWAVIEKDTASFAGQCGLTWQDVEGERVLEIGYLFKQSHWHKGYATEAAVACKRYAFDVLDAPEVCSIIRDTNDASRRVALRNGMQPVRHFTKHYRGVDMPHTVFAITRETHRKQP